MKIQAQSSLLLRKALQKAAKCIDSKSAVAILSNVLLTQRKEDGKFFFVSATTDSELTIPAPLSIVEGSFKEDAVLPITSLLSLLSTLPADCVVTMDLSQDKEHNMNIEYCTQSGENVKKGNVSMVYFGAESFPRAAQPDDTILHISLPMETFKNVLSHAGKFIDNSELHPIMNCLCIDVAEDRSDVTFVASNGHVLIKLIHTNNPETGAAISSVKEHQARCSFTALTSRPFRYLRNAKTSTSNATRTWCALLRAILPFCAKRWKVNTLTIIPLSLRTIHIRLL